MIRLSRSEVRMITLVLTGQIPAEDLCNLVYQALSSGYGLEVTMDHYLAHSGITQNGALGSPQAPPKLKPPSISVVNFSYTYMGNSSVDLLCELIHMEGSLLRTIDISFCGLEDRGCIALAKAFTKRKRNGIAPLRGIILSGNHISYKGATDLGRALSPRQTSGRVRKPSGRRKSGGYEEDNESDDSSNVDEDEMNNNVEMEDSEAAKKLIGFGESKRDESLDVAEHAAWTVIASMILNLNETLTRG